ncbi:MAG TPA: HAMP domain-containing sensor histidine kinase [Desulfobacteraceae bacterium]|nr:HAMP domain-containing sensor histidine kinase [Desulfobacteraceae bacterium]HPQ29552.1 HAMP domain-containing sensor histidine kinase [Desulfobacteraceae bacterium]
MDNLQKEKKDNGVGRDRIKIDILIHDLKVPLAVIEAGVSSLLKRPEKYGPLTEKQKNVLHRALRNTKTTQTLVNDVLELGKSAQGILNLTSCRVSSLIEQTLVEIFDLAESDTSENIRNCTNLALFKDILKNQGIYLSVDEALWYEDIYLDETKIRQILRNLLSNGLKYRKAVIELAIYKESGYFIISVKDDGEGIPPVYHKKIFECYFQMDANEICSVRGHGLGLAGVMVLVEDMEGGLFLESEQGKGAKFIVKLPLQKV